MWCPLIFERWRRPSLDWLQVEVTTRCNAACTYCPRTVYRDAWIDRDISGETFTRLVPAFRDAKLVFLQGWGEPLLHPRFFEMAVEAKRAGSRVGLATNGTLVDDQSASELVRAGVDVVSFSLAGADRTNDRVRLGTRLREVLDAIACVRRARERLGRAAPSIHVAYLLLRSGLDDVARLPDLLAGAGVSQVVISTLDFVPSAELADEAVHPGDRRGYEEIRSRLEDVVADGKRRGVEIHAQLRHPGERRFNCAENARRAAFVSANGSVSPCVFTNLPVSASALVGDGLERPYERRVFGDLGDRSLTDIWRGRSYARFRESFFDEAVDRACRGCPKLWLRRIE